MADIDSIAFPKLHFGSPSAFHDIYHGSKRWDKDPGLYRTPGVTTGSFVFLKYAQAKERREVLLPIFSKKAINSLEHLVWRNVSSALLVSGSNIPKYPFKSSLTYQFQITGNSPCILHHQDQCNKKLNRPTLCIPILHTRHHHVLHLW